MTKNKTLAAWLAFLGGPIGLHRFYLYGMSDVLAWLLPLPTALGGYGLWRVQQWGLDDHWSWVLIPFLGMVIAACSLTAIVYALSSAEKWNGRFNPGLAVDAQQGQSQWLTVAAIVVSLLVGATSLVSSMAFSFQRYFEYQVEAAREISQ